VVIKKLAEEALQKGDVASDKLMLPTFGAGLMNKVLNVEVSDTTGDAIRTTAGNQKIITSVSFVNFR